MNKQDLTAIFSMIFLVGSLLVVPYMHLNLLWLMPSALFAWVNQSHIVGMVKSFGTGAMLMLGGSLAMADVLTDIATAVGSGAIANTANTVADTVTGSGIGDALATMAITALAASNPVVAGLIVALPLFSWIVGLFANNSDNPTVNKVYIGLNKIAQLAGAKTAKNQPDVLTVKTMLTNNPNDWSSLIKNQIIDETHTAIKLAIVNKVRAKGDADALSDLFAAIKKIKKQINKG